MLKWAKMVVYTIIYSSAENNIIIKSYYILSTLRACLMAIHVRSARNLFFRLTKVHFINLWNMKYIQWCRHVSPKCKLFNDISHKETLTITGEIFFYKSRPGDKVPLVASERVSIDEFLIPSPSRTKPSRPLPFRLSPPFPFPVFSFMLSSHLLCWNFVSFCRCRRTQMCKVCSIH